MMEDVLGFCALVLTVLMMLGLIGWFCCSIVESLMKIRRGLKKPRYRTLLRENERLKSILADTVQEHRLKRLHRTEIVRRKSNRISRSVA